MHISEAEPVRGIALPVAKPIDRLVAPNPGSMTYHGTNTYLVRTASGLVVIDPGPDLPDHIETLSAQCGPKAAYIFLTHHHADHCGAAEALRERTGAKLVAAENSGYQGGKVDIRLADGESLAGFTALATPGHTEDHLCFQFERVIFTGDHVMGWATTAVLAPEGNASRYLESLRRLVSVRARHFLPAHGPKIAHTQRYLTFLIAKAEEKERQLLSTLARRPGCVEQIIAETYGELSQDMRRVARRTIEALLLCLERTGKVIREDDTWRVLQ